MNVGISDQILFVLEDEGLDRLNDLSARTAPIAIPVAVLNGRRWAFRDGPALNRFRTTRGADRALLSKSAR